MRQLRRPPYPEFRADVQAVANVGIAEMELGAIGAITTFLADAPESVIFSCAAVMSVGIVALATAVVRYTRHFDA